MSIQTGNLYRRKSDDQVLKVISYTETLVQYQEQGELGTGSASMVRFYDEYEELSSTWASTIQKLIQISVFTPLPNVSNVAASDLRTMITGSFALTKS